MTSPGRAPTKPCRTGDRHASQRPQDTGQLCPPTSLGAAHLPKLLAAVAPGHAALAVRPAIHHASEKGAVGLHGRVSCRACGRSASAAATSRVLLCCGSVTAVAASAAIAAVRRRKREAPRPPHDVIQKVTCNRAGRVHTSLHASWSPAATPLVQLGFTSCWACHGWKPMLPNPRTPTFKALSPGGGHHARPVALPL